ncbi:hypothetical protein [Vogesella indigofera]|uniref:Uncharacterized protein n=1 Tax=Vogesella indigofera TaxID=45465 RepID=A0ABT5I8G1_VOGIN|nr:hypothetical protein [Vogesella indigofera]MDC7692476.1 hypothetical protein [Vogesella indigofera]
MNEIDNELEFESEHDEQEEWNDWDEEEANRPDSPQYPELVPTPMTEEDALCELYEKQYADRYGHIIHDDFKLTHVRFHC